MSIHGSMFAGAAARLSLPGLTPGRGASASFAARLGLSPSGRYVTRFVGGIVIAMLLAVIAFPAPARAQTITISSVTTSPASVQAGQTVTFTATMTANENLSNYPVLFSLMAPGASAGTNTMQGLDWATFTAGKSVSEAYRWTVPAGTKVGTYTLYVAVYNPAWSVKYAQTTATLAITAAGVTGAPTDMEPPVVSGTAQVGDLLASTTGTWTGAVSYAYQWAGNGAKIAGATAATYAPVSSDTGHTLTSTVTATGSSSATASATSAPTVPIVAASSSQGGSKGVAFTALHTYFMSPTGSDSNNGLTAATAWATANHAVKCGDVIIAAAGSYNTSLPGEGFGAVSNCPSASGGIDGTGGIYFATLLCGGTYVGACTITEPNKTAFEPTSNWAIEGWQVSGIGAGYTAFMPYACTSGTVLHHIALINDISFNLGQAYGTNDCGMSGAGKTSPGSDYVAVIGNIAQNAAQNTICLAAIDGVGVARYDAIPGTHIYFYGNFAWANLVRCNTDGEAFMFDTLDGNGFAGTAIMANNIAWDSERYGIQVYDQNINSNAPTVKLYNNTLFDNNNDTSGTARAVVGEINIQNSTGSPFLWTISSYNNISKPNFATNASGEYVYSELVNAGGSNVTVGGSNSQNIFKGKQTACYGTTCDPGFNVVSYASGPLGTNTYSDPLFTNTSDLLSNRNGAPNCSSFANVTACMGWNANTSTLTPDTPIYDLTPAASGVSKKGYQLPSTTCAANADYPAWLKGVVYLQWNGSSLTENSDLVTKPCNM